MASYYSLTQTAVTSWLFGISMTMMLVRCDVGQVENVRKHKMMAKHEMELTSAIKSHLQSN